MAIVFGIGFLLLTSMFVSTVVAAPACSIVGDFALVSTVVDAALTVCVTTIFFAAIFKVLGDVGLGRRNVLPVRRCPQCAVHARQEPAGLVPGAGLDHLGVR